MLQGSSKLWLSIFILSLVACFDNPPERIYKDDVQLTRSRQGGLFLKSDQPFTGVVIDRNTHGNILGETQVVKGLKHGIKKRLYLDGTTLGENRYSKGLREGPNVEYWSNGSLKLKTQYKNDRLDGLYQMWSKTGQLIQEHRFVDGKESGRQKIWNSQAQLESNYVVHSNRRYGIFKSRDCMGGDSSSLKSTLNLKEKSIDQMNKLDSKDLSELNKLTAIALPVNSTEFKSTVVQSLPYYVENTLSPIWLDSTGIEYLHSTTLGHRPKMNFKSHQVSQIDLNKVSIVHFFFTGCTGLCPRLFKQLKTIEPFLNQNSLSVNLLSLTVTPEIDHLVRLEEYANGRIKMKSKNWHLVNAEAIDLVNWAQNYFYALAPTMASADNSASSQIHSENVYLMDSDGYIRGVYNGTLSLEMIKLEADTKKLLSL